MIVALEQDFFDFRDEAKALISSYLAEVTTPFEKDIAWDHYSQLWGMGSLHIVGARDAGRLVGFLAFIVYDHPNAVGVRVGQELALFLKPEYRRGLTGVKMIKIARDKSKELGSKYFTITARPGKDIGPLLEKLGAKPFETAYVMEI